ncbi:hypothetical protein PTNB73_01484 [Pyrenophora teres f. teres]|uniref:Uncharacterized protein n=1 Tax=Pyrenophora teres f. teres TaxID=97479 RepID=A0A6S6VZA9_9PLEO|nr:hypothetical protein HRS9139_00066 [Pyrenophora teres f. teres]KAE8847636.1 hypothetical protein PTNB85_01479 [Pyrenophora teres f. teres]KAE8854206.1 hypothetical protein HRS9122_01198 [Pyrenophora teres f. teres]KAE8867565.1 hypothetical protein PTNB29_01476 [Pyrenophora teres f. teres]KAE8872333.1 hypothetical protein PTNB73_01484 [Pyrenophora teres f. teres]
MVAWEILKSSISRSQTPEPSIPAIRPAPDDDGEQAPTRKRFDSQTLERIQANIQSLKCNTTRRTSSGASQRRSSSAGSVAKSVAENGEEYTEGGVRLDNGRTTPPAGSGDASPPEPVGATRRKLIPKGPGKTRLCAVLMKTIRPVPVAEKPVSPPLSPQSPVQESTEKPTEEPDGEHMEETIKEPIEGHIMESAEEFSAQ